MDARIIQLIEEFLKSSEMKTALEAPDNLHDQIVHNANALNKKHQYNGYIITMESEPGKIILTKSNYASFKT